MVAKFVASVRGFTFRAVAIIAVLALLPLLLLLPGRVEGSSYSNPWWSSNSTSPESAIGLVASRSMSPEGVDLRTGEWIYDQELFTTPGLVSDNGVSLRWRSMVSGTTQFGRGWLASFEITAKQTVVNSGNPIAVNGNYVDIRRPSGRIDRFNWNGSAYDGPSDVTDTLTIASGLFVLTDKFGNLWGFDSLVMPETFTAPHGKVDTYSYNSSFQVTGWTDERGKSTSFARNSSGYVTSITDPAGRAWAFAYDAVTDELLTVTSPATPDQTSGVTTTFTYDTYHRLSTITDGRGTLRTTLSYAGSTGRVTSIALVGGTISYSYSSGTTDRTDRLGNVRRTTYSGAQVTKTEMIVASASKYAALFRYSGDWPANVAYPRGNRVDTTYDSKGNLTSRRARTADTSTNASTDLVESWSYNSANFMTSYTDARGSTWTYSVNSVGDRTGETNPTVTNPSTQASSRSTSFNSAGQVTSETDEEGRFVSYSYNASGANIGLLYSRTVDPSGLALTTTFAYDGAWNVSAITDPRSHASSYAWDALRRLTQSTAPSPLSYGVAYHYDENGNLTSKEVENLDKDGVLDSSNPSITTSLTYTDDDRIEDITEEVTASTTRTTSLEYDANRNLLRVVKPEGNKDRFYYEERDLLWKATKAETSSISGTYENSYDDNGNLVTVKDAFGTTATTNTYDLFDRKTKETNAAGVYTSFDYDENGNTTAIYRKNSSNVTLQRSSRYFDERNRLWKTSDLFYDLSSTYSDAVTTIARYKTGEASTVTNPRGKTKTFDLDAAGRLTKVTDAMGNELSSTYDECGNATGLSIKEIDGTSSVTHAYEATYDVLGRRLTTVEVDRTNSSNRLTTTFGYDSRSNLVWKVNAENNPTRWTFDGLSRMVKLERALSVGSTLETFVTAQVTQYGFDRNDRLVSQKDDALHETTWTYDTRDRATRQTMPDTTFTDRVFDVNDNVVQVTDPYGTVVADTFDTLNRMTARAVTRATGVIDTTWETRTYDELDRVTAAEDDDTKVEFGYGCLGLSSFVYGDSQTLTTGTPNNKVVDSRVDANGNVVTQHYPSGLSLTRTYNDIDEPAAITDGTNTIANYSYIGFRLKCMQYQNGTTDNRSYTGFRDEVASIQHKTSGSVTFLQMDYGYNKVHETLFERFGGSGAAGDAFAYDKLGRLTTAWMGSVTPATPSSAQYVKKIDYALDDDGNRTSVTTTPWGGTPATVNYTSNSLDLYTAVGGVSRAYDPNGNATNTGTYKFRYNYLNLICESRDANTNALIATYKYDPLGRLVRKSLSGGATERFVYWGPDIVSRLNASNVWEQDVVEGCGGCDGGWWGSPLPGSRKFSKPAGWAPIMLIQADVEDFDGDADTSEITRSFYHMNWCGSVGEITDLNGHEVESLAYDPFGHSSISRNGIPQGTDVLGQSFGWCGGLNSPEVGGIAFGVQVFDPATGRLLQCPSSLLLSMPWGDVVDPMRPFACAGGYWYPGDPIDPSFPYWPLGGPLQDPNPDAPISPWDPLAGLFGSSPQVPADVPGSTRPRRPLEDYPGLDDHREPPDVDFGGTDWCGNTRDETNQKIAEAYESTAEALRGIETVDGATEVASAGTLYSGLVGAAARQIEKAAAKARLRKIVEEIESGNWCGNSAEIASLAKVAYSGFVGRAENHHPFMRYLFGPNGVIVNIDATIHRFIHAAMYTARYAPGRGIRVTPMVIGFLKRLYGSIPEPARSMLLQAMERGLR